MIELLNTLNSLSPLAIIALGMVIIFTLVKQHKTLTGNHLHEIPEMNRKLDRIKDSNLRQELVLERMITVLECIRDGRRRQ